MYDNDKPFLSIYDTTAHVPIDGASYWTIMEASRRLDIPFPIGKIGHHYSLELRYCECTDKKLVQYSIYSIHNITNNYKCTYKKGLQLMQDFGYEAKQWVYSGKRGYLWKLDSVGLSNIKLFSTAWDDGAPLGIFDNEDEANAEWDVMVNLGQGYSYASANNWPQSIYQTLGNNSNTFARWVVGQSEYMFIDLPGNHPGNYFPQQIDSSDYGPLEKG